eukprot:s3931_g8.t14
MLLAWADAVEVFVMLGLDAVTQSGDLKDPESLRAQLQQLRRRVAAQTESWQMCGGVPPNQVQNLTNLMDTDSSSTCERALPEGVVQLVTSFHQCGGNVGDTCDIPLPAFVTSQGDIWYKDQHGHEDKEYISLFADNVTIEGRTPLQMYSDWFNALSASFAADLGSVIEEIQVEKRMQHFVVVWAWGPLASLDILPISFLSGSSVVSVPFNATMPMLSKAFPAPQRVQDMLIGAIPPRMLGTTTATQVLSEVVADFCDL